ncbi:hypothetical protein [Xenorhabdus cabanillasii]|uniref:hypothetical protein n=1 Tax=Xenorhabdus cabanillasii TaxID=351673 RepID=UPI001FD62D05|nr:hypothetical protein [Xenorhabdus cabanillasii]
MSIQPVDLRLAQVTAADLVTLDSHHHKRCRGTVAVVLRHFQQILALGKTDRAFKFMDIDKQTVTIRVIIVLAKPFNADSLEAGDIRVLIDQLAQGASQWDYAGDGGIRRLAGDLDPNLVRNLAINVGQQQLVTVTEQLRLEAFSQGVFRHQMVGEVLLDEPGFDQH